MLEGALELDGGQERLRQEVAGKQRPEAGQGASCAGVGEGNNKPMALFKLNWQ